MAYYESPKSKVNSTDHQNNLIDSYKLKLKVFHHLVQKYKFVLSSFVDDAFYTGICLAIGIAQKDMHYTESGLDENVSSTFDYYKDPCISEIQPTINILDRLKKRILAELQQWPDHPVLNDVKYLNHA